MLFFHLVVFVLPCTLELSLCRLSGVLLLLAVQLFYPLLISIVSVDQFMFTYNMRYRFSSWGILAMKTV